MYVIMKMGRCHLKMLGARRRHHLNREHLMNREHPERQKYNEYRENGGTLYEQAGELLEQHKRVTGRKARTDAVVMIDFVFTVSPESRDELLENKKKWVQLQMRWVKENFPDSKICAVSYEEDETTPHLHVYVAATEEKGNLNAKKIIGNASKMSSYQTNYENYMIDSELFKDVKRRTKQKDRKEKVHNVPIRKYKAQQQEEIKELERRLAELKRDVADRILDERPIEKRNNEKLFEGDFLDL